MNELTPPPSSRDEAPGGALIRRDDGTVLAAERKLEEFLEEQEQESALTQYMQMLFRRRWVVLGTVLIALLIALYVTLTTTPLYRATTSLQIERQAAKVVEGSDVEAPASQVNQEFYQTQYGLLKSRALAEAVVRRLRLDSNDTLLYGYTRRKLTGRAEPTPNASRDALIARATGIVQRNVTVTPVRASSLVSVSFDSPDPQLSAEVANAIGDAFIASNLQRRFDATAYARRFLEDRLEQVRRRLESSERDVVGYASKERIINLDAPSQGSDQQQTQGRSLVGADLESANSALAAATNDRIAAEARYRQAAATGGIATAEGASDSTIGQLRSQRAQLNAEYQKNLGQYKPDFPAQVAIKSQIAEIDRQLSSASGNVLTTLRSAYQAAAQREGQLRAKVNGLQGQVLDLRRRSIQYNIYQRDADTNRELYNGLLQRYKEIGVAGGVGTNNVSIVDTALPPGAPFVPKTFTNLALGLLAGLLLGGALAFLVEQLDESIIAPHDLEKKLGVPLLGSIPRTAEGGGTVLELLDDRKSAMAEAYLSVQTALRFSTPQGAPRALLVTSAQASEGKSTTAYAIAKNFAMMGRSVVLIDSDLRRPSVHKVHGLPNIHGLSNALAGEDHIDPLMQRSATENLAIITSGPLPPNPSELLASPRFELLIAQLLQNFDHVVVDSPPVMGLADAPLIASYVEATVFVIVAKETRTKTARMALRRLAGTHAHIVGAVLTKFDARQVGYDYGYAYYNYEERKPTLVERAKTRLRLT